MRRNSHLKSLTRAIRARELKPTPDPLQLWRMVVVVAVTRPGNEYSLDVQIKVLMWLKMGMCDCLITWADAVSAQTYGTPMEHYRMHQLAALIRKYPFPPAISGFNPREAALAKFREAEHRCKRYNQRFRAFLRTGRDPLGPVIHRAQKWIQTVIGTKVPFQEVYNACAVTPGACIGVHGNATNLGRKLHSGTWSCTPGALSYAIEAMWSCDHMRELVNKHNDQFHAHDPELFASRVRARVALTHHNKVSFVPKTAKTHRSIAVEPFLNTYLQKGIDTVLKRRLMRAGLNLYDQAPNARLARLGSFPEAEDAYCTIDLSSASDTIAIEVVKALLPEDWYIFLQAVRCSRYVVAGREATYEKFVSMGNGFCFPLETLVFGSLVAAAHAQHGTKADFLVYGDDIVVRRHVFDTVMLYLREFGFVPNTRKTFADGIFRESCGWDWHGGVNVRPIFLDGPLDTLAALFGFHNQTLRRESYVRDYFSSVRSLLKEAVPRKVRFVCERDPASVLHPDLPEDAWENPSYDGAFWVPLDEVMESKHAVWDRGEQRWKTTQLRLRPTRDTYMRGDRIDSTVYMMGALLGCPEKVPFTLRYQTQAEVVTV